MRCRGCGYLLFDLPPGPCPECGREFRPTEFRFKPRRVGFLCSACGHAYQGLDADGLPHPKRFACKECGAEVDAAHMIVTLPEGADPDGVMVHESPWEAREELGSWRAFWRTLGWSFVRPGRLGHDLTDEGGVGNAFWFAARVYGMLLIFNIFLSSLLFMVMAAGTGGGISALGFLVAMPIIMYALWLFVGMPLWALLAHGFLCITGARRGGYGLTLRALLYAQGPTVAAGFPYCGWLIGGLWTTVSSCLSVTAAQRVSGLRGTIAALTMPALSILAVTGIYLWLILYLANISAGLGTMAVQSPSAVGQAIVDSAGVDGEAVNHVIELVETDVIDHHSIHHMNDLDQYRTRKMDKAPLPGGFLGLWGLTPEELGAVRAALEDDEEFYAFYGMIFAHRGVDFRSAPRDLIIAYTHPDQLQQAFDQIVVFKADGTQSYYWQSAWARELRNQDRLREDLGLMPLPWEVDLPPTLEERFGDETDE